MAFPLSNDRERLANYIETNSVRGVEDTEAQFGETMQAGFDQVLNEERTDSRNRAFNPFYEERANLIGTLGGDVMLAKRYVNGDMVPVVEQVLDTQGETAARIMLADTDASIVDAIIQQRKFEQAFPGQVLSDGEITTLVSADLAEKRKINESILSRGSGFAAFLGQTGALITDPPVLVTLPLGPGPQVGRSLVTNAARGFVGEAGVALAIEVPIQAEVFDFKQEIESPWSFADAAVNTLSAALGAGAFRAAGSVTIDTASSLLKKYRRTPVSTRTAETDAAADVLERLVELNRENPLARLERSLEGADQIDPGQADLVAAQHVQAIEQARAASEAGESVDVRETVQGSEPLNEIDQTGNLTIDDVDVFGPDELNVDAARFQFKEGGDAQGVTSSLEDVTQFDRSLAGQILVFEDKAGARFVVDGHQRVGLAKRAIAGGQDPNEVKLSGFILKEADGITDVDAMRIGAVRNLTASTGTALDAAKVLRGIGPAGEALLPPLPPNSALLRQGRFLSRLGDDAFNAVVNEIVPARQAAHVGELIQGDAEQSAALQILARLKPANEVQARAMVEQIRAAGFERKTTTDLFGEQEVAQSLIRERAQVIDATLKTAKADRATFGQLVSRGTDIQGVGANRLDAGANQSRVDESGQAIEIITRLANQKGPVSEAITEAARRVASGEKPADVIDAVLESVGRAPEVSDTGGRVSADVRAGEPNIRQPGELDPDGIPINPIDRSLDDTAKAEALHVLGEENNAIVEPILKAIDDALGTTSKTSFKKIGTILEKVKRATVLAKRPWMQVENIRDSFRFKTVIEPESDIGAIGLAVKQMVDAVPGMRIIKEDVNMMFNPKEWGWRAAVFDIEMPNGQIVEWYMPIRELEDAKKAGGHKLFDDWRDEDINNLDPVAVAQLYQVRNEAQTLYGDAWDKALARMGQDETAARASLDKSLASVPDSVRNDSAIDSPVMGVLPDLDQTSFSRIPRKPSAPNTKTRPSESSIDTASTTGPPPSDTSISGGSRSRNPDLLGNDTRSAQALADETAGGTKRLTEEEFSDTFSQHVDIRGREKGNQANNAVSILATGFRKGFPNVLPIPRPGARLTSPERQFAPKDGDTVFLIPKDKIDKRGKIKEGHKPSASEILKIQGNESLFEAFNRQLDQADGATDPTDLFSQASRQQDLIEVPDRPRAGRPDEGSATGFVSDNEYDSVLRTYELLDQEAGELVQLPIVRVDEAGQQAIEARSARQVMTALEREERALVDIEVCSQ